MNRYRVRITTETLHRLRFARILRTCVLILPQLLPIGIVSSVQAQQPDAAIRGRIIDVRGVPIAGARISFSSPSGAAGAALTGADGRYSIPSMSGSVVTLVASADGYRTARHENMVVGDTSFDMVLEPARYRLGAISVTGRSRPEIAAIPGAATIVGASVLRDRAPISVMEALRTVPGVHTTDEDPFGLNLNVGFRGLPPRRSSRTLLLEDGAPILLGPYGDPSMHYAPPVEAIDRIEVVKGSSQVMNGPQTVGGVINFVTRRPPVDGTRGSLTLGAGGAGYRNAHVWAGAGLGAGGVALDYTYREGDGVRREQGHRFHNVLLSTMIPVGVGTLLLKGSVWDEASRISETGLTQAEFDADPYSLPFSGTGRFDVRRYAGQVLHELEHERVRLRTRAYASTTDRASWRQSGESEERLGEDGYADDFNCPSGAVSYDQCGNQGRPRQYDVAGLEPRLTIEIGRAGAGAAIDVGGRLYREDVHRRQFTGNTPTSREDDAVLTHDNRITTRATAAFGQMRLRAGSGTVSPALRIEHLSQRVANRFPGAEAEVDVEYAQLLPGIGATFELPHGATLFGGVHRGFAPPRPADVYRPAAGQPLVLVDAETSWNWELGSRIEPRPGISAEATLFRMDFGNQIIEAPADAGQRFTNGGRTLHQGIELAAHASVGTLRGWRDDLMLSAALTWLPIARFRSGDERGMDIVGNRLPYAPRTLGSASAAFAHRSGITAGTAVEYTGRQFADPENTPDGSADGQRGTLPAYGVLNASASYLVPGTQLQARFSARNVLNSVYIAQRNEGIYTGTRRLLRAEVQWTFQE